MERSIASATDGSPLVENAEVPIRQTEGSMMPDFAFAWLTDALARLEERSPGGVVIELGSGFGTSKLLNILPRSLRLISIEHNDRFVDLIPDATYIHAPIHNGWYDRRVLERELPPNIVAVIVDGPPGTFGRDRLLDHLDLFPANVPMLIDDAQRATEAQLAAAIGLTRGEQVDVHQCNGGRAFATLGWP